MKFPVLVFLIKRLCRNLQMALQLSTPANTLRDELKRRLNYMKKVITTASVLLLYSGCCAVAVQYSFERTEANSKQSQPLYRGAGSPAYTSGVLPRDIRSRRFSTPGALCLGHWTLNDFHINSGSVFSVHVHPNWHHSSIPALFVSVHIL